MPCYDPDYSASIRVAEIRKWMNKTNDLTRMLCGLMTEMTRAGLDVDEYATPELLRWWKEHQRFDNQRKNKKNNGK